MILIGCANLNYVTNKENKSTANLSIQSTNLSNATNTTIPDYMPIYDGSLYYFIADDGVLILKNTTSIAVDAGKFNAMKTLQKYGRKPNALIITLDKPEKSDGARYFILALKPDAYIDAGIPIANRAETIRYTSLLNTTVKVINTEKIIQWPDLSVHFFVPFEKRGIVVNMDYNSIPVQIENLLYMSNCYGECESSVDTKAKYIMLANNGKCPTNGLDFIFNTRSQERVYIFGTELCSDFLNNAHLKDVNELALLGVQFVQVNGVMPLKDE